MTEIETIACEVRLAGLKRKLAAREGQPGYKANCEDIRREIARIEALLAG